MPPFSFIRQFERARFYTGRLLTAADLQDEQDYFREKIRLHNRLLHGWGVVTGLKVSECAGTLTVSAGLALDCAGNELVLAEAKHIALSNVAAKQYVTIQYVEVPTGQQPSATGDAQFSKIREDVRVEITSTASGRARRQRSHWRLWRRPSAVLGHDPSVRLEVADQH